MPLLYVPFPAPVVTGEACDGCDGAGVLVTRKAIMDLDDGQGLLVDAFCPSCGGCGSEAHGDCADGSHTWDDDDDPEREDADALADRCLSCAGRGWNAVVGFEAETEATGPDQVLSAQAIKCGPDGALSEPLVGDGTGTALPPIEEGTTPDTAADSGAVDGRQMLLRLPCGCQESRAKPLEQVEF